MAVVQSCTCLRVYAFTHKHLKGCGTAQLFNVILVRSYSLILVSQGTPRTQENIIIP